MRLLIVVIISLCVCVASRVHAVTAGQTSLKIQPLEYRETLGEGEKKKGFIDISNPTNQKLHLKVQVNAFRQINNRGEITFYDDDRIEQGIKTDFDEFELAPRQVLRMVFLVDGTKLPHGNIFAVIFFATQADGITQAAQQLRLGTILSLTNQTPPSQHVAIRSLDMAPLQLGQSIEGRLTVRNIGDPKKETGFYPRLTLQVDPIFSLTQRFEGPLVFPGFEREKSFSLDSSRIGFYRLSVLDSRERELSSQWFFAMTGWARVVFFSLICLVGAYAIHIRNKMLRGETQVSRPVKKKIQRPPTERR